MPLHLELLWGATVMPLRRACDGLGWNKTVRVSKNFGLVLSRLWTKVHEISGQHRRPFVLPNALVRLSMSRFVQNTFIVKSRSRRKIEQMKKFLWRRII